MRSTIIVSSNVRRCTLQFYRRMHNTAAPAVEHRLKPLSVSQCMYSMDQTTWRDKEIPEMRAIWPDIVRNLTETEPFNIAPGAMKWMAKMLHYNVNRGNKRRYLALVYAYKNLVPEDQLTQENLRLARILGWCIEMLEAGFLVFDDVVDNSETRRHQVCWHKKDNIGVSAMIDAVNLMYLPYELLRRHFKEKPCYLNLLETFQQIPLKTTIGMSSEMLASNFEKKPDLNKFTMDLYQTIISYKTAYTMVMPVHLAMHLAGIKDPEMFKQAEIILLEIGRFYQVQNDYLDCFGDPELKSETDIPKGMLSWPIVSALERVTPEQRKLLEECYGDSDPKKITKVKHLYNDLGMQMLYAAHEEQSYNLVSTYIQQTSGGLPRNIFLKFRDDIYNLNAQQL
jgi:farnesyl diphosphate synthase